MPNLEYVYPRMKSVLRREPLESPGTSTFVREETTQNTYYDRDEKIT